MSLGFPRLARAGAAAGLAVACLGLNAASASAATNPVRSQEWWLQALHVTQAWHSTRGGGVTVAVLDTARRQLDAPVVHAARPALRRRQRQRLSADSEQQWIPRAGNA